MLSIICHLDQVAPDGSRPSFCILVVVRRIACTSRPPSSCLPKSSSRPFSSSSVAFRCPKTLFTLHDATFPSFNLLKDAIALSLFNPSHGSMRQFPRFPRTLVGVTVDQRDYRHHHTGGQLLTCPSLWGECGGRGWLGCIRSNPANTETLLRLNGTEQIKQQIHHEFRPIFTMQSSSHHTLNQSEEEISWSFRMGMSAFLLGKSKRRCLLILNRTVPGHCLL
jgi:hypothetical protein